MDYSAIFGIGHGVANMGLKRPGYIEKTERFFARTPQQALDKAMRRARRFANEYLSDPDTGKTKVTLKDLYDPQGRPVDIEPLEVDLCSGLAVEEGHLVVCRTMGEHLLGLA